ncbi:MAG: hypothetical protein ABSC16_04870 [Candidatus Dormibacteria bacterium]|nr:hypothetical protein [Chloroflexota bacterium]HBV94493.1 hypothetical protein [Chloroflexota bacterium]
MAPPGHRFEGVGESASQLAGAQRCHAESDRLRVQGVEHVDRKPVAVGGLDQQLASAQGPAGRR